ncbi:MAG: magnesium chelatase [Thermoplasmata archaeon]|nr:MAG: magnesium chelatase [Thermoplasmata archaeon]
MVEREYEFVGDEISYVEEVEKKAEIEEWKDIGKDVYPFAAIVNQETMKRALILNIINPEIGGVLIRGEKGSGKSVAVRGLEELLPEIEVFEGCMYNCDPRNPKTWCAECKEKNKEGSARIVKKKMKIVNLPLNITEDRLVGTIDVERILKEGMKAFEPGLLAYANRNVLYVDEVNLLPDNIVDLLLDAAAMGVVTVEREGVSVSYYSKFILIGSMNPEEGELRPQLIDRFALQAMVKGTMSLEERIEIVKRVDEYSRDKRAFREKFMDETEKIRERIETARRNLPKVRTPDKMMKIIAQIGIDFGVQGHRADIIMDRTARTNAAYEGREETNLDDVILAAELALPHRMRRMPLEEEEFSAEMLRKLVKRYI